MSMSSRRRHDPKLLVYFDDEQHLVRRLGAAVISCWQDLDPALRRRLFDRSIQVYDDPDTEKLEAQFRRFLAEHSRVEFDDLPGLA